MRAKVFRIGFAPDTLGGSEVVADFATDLIALLTIVEVKKVRRRIAMFATTMKRNCKTAATPDRQHRFGRAFFTFGFEFAPIGLRRNRRPRRRSKKRWSGIDAKLAIVFGLRFRFELKSGF